MGGFSFCRWGFARRPNPSFGWKGTVPHARGVGLSGDSVLYTYDRMLRWQAFTTPMTVSICFGGTPRPALPIADCQCCMTRNEPVQTLPTVVLDDVTLEVAESRTGGHTACVLKCMAKGYVPKSMSRSAALAPSTRT